jgi:beta-lactamase regulating signal transducer with metallopeptidase domain
MSRSMFQALLDGAEFALSWLIHAAWQAGLLAAAVLALTWLLRSRLQPRWRFALWLVVLARLALPVLPAAPWSAFQLVSIRSTPQRAAIVDSSTTLSPLRSDATSYRVDGVFADSSTRKTNAHTPTAFEAAELPLHDAMLPAVYSVSPIHLAALVWMTGMVVFSLRYVASTLSLRRRQRRWQEVTDPEILSVLQSCRRELRLRRTVSLRTTSENLGPATCGIVRSCIVLPQRLLSALSPAELRLVLLHELVHVRRHDVVVDQLASFVTIFHWFHPVAWLARYFLRRERELACDAAVLDLAVPSAAADYGHTILKTVESLAQPAPLPGLVGMFGGGSFSLLARRIRLIVAYRRTTWLSVVSGGLLLVALALVGLTDAQQKQQPPNPAQPPASPAQPDGTAAKAQAAKDTEDKEPEESTYSVPITISGRALDPAGKPISGAEVYLAAGRPGYQRIAEGKTAADGTYRFEKIPLPILRADTNAGHDAGGFEVFGIAEGYALAWRPQKWFYPDRKQYRERLAFSEYPAGYGTEDPIELDLTFAPPTTIRGRIVDDLGEPIPKTKLAIRYGDPGWDQPDFNRQPR